VWLITVRIALQACKAAIELTLQGFKLSTSSNLSNFIPLLNTMSSSTFPPEELKAIVQEVATFLQERKETISVAETVHHPLLLTLISNSPSGSRRPHIRDPPLLSRRLQILQRWSHTLHARIPHRIRRLDTAAHRELQRSHARDCIWASGAHAQDAG
jgi:hypothetical protein